MTRMETLIREAEDAPEFLLDKTLDFLRFLKSQYQQADDGGSLETMLLSESALKKDWLRPEEDEAWQDL